MTAPVSDALLKLRGEWEGFDVERFETEAEGDDVFEAPAGSCFGTGPISRRRRSACDCGSSCAPIAPSAVGSRR
jgi:hypothetical protein